MYLIRSLNRITLLLLTAIFFSLSSCKIDEDLAKPTLSPDFIIPLVYGELDLKNLVRDTSFIKTDPSGYLKVGFLDTLEILNSTTLADALRIVQVGFPSVPKTLSFTSAGGANIQFPSEELLDINLNLGTSMVRKLAFNELTFKIIITNSHSFAYNDLIVNIPGLTTGGTSFSSGPINVSATPGTPFEKEFTLTNCIWDLSGKTGLDTSKVLMAFTTTTGTPIVGPGGGTGFIQVEFMSYNLKFWQGKSGILQQLLSTTISTSNTTSLVPKETYKGIKSGSLNLEDVDVKLDFISKMGIPLGMNIVLESTNGVTNAKVALNPLNLNIQQSSIASNNEPNSKSNLTIINESTSNLADVLTNFPTTIKVTAGVATTFNNPDPYGYFFHQNSDLQLTVDATIPFAISFNQLRLESNYDFDLFAQANLDSNIARLDTGTLFFTISNGFPYEIDLDLNALNGALDSVAKLAQIRLAAGTTGLVGGEIKVVSPTKSTFTVGLSANLLEKIKVAKKLGVKAKLNTAPGISPKIYTDYKLGFDTKARLGVTAKPIK
jgi:hypothetical protein